MRKNLTGKIKFPIDTPTACRWKWAWSSLYLNNGTTSSCHRASSSKINVDNFDTFHNTPEKISARKTMLDGKWPAGGCEYCQRIENAGGTSDRIYQSSKPGIPPELAKDPNETSVTPVELEVFINNICNLKCIYCSGLYSSTIAAEDAKFSTQLRSFVNEPYQTPSNDALLFEKFIIWYEQNGNTLQRLNILGGEPLYQKKFYTLLEIIEQQKNTNLELSITTNLMAPQRYLEQFHEIGNRMLRNKSVKRIDLLCSVEGLGSGQEYVRNGFETEQWKQNFEHFLYKSYFNMMFLSTVNILVIDDMLALAQQWLEWKEHKNIFWSLHDVLPESSCLNLSHYNSNLYEEKLQNVIDLIDNTTSADLLDGIVQKSKSQPVNLEKYKQLLLFLNEVDRRRNTNWRTTFPWLTKELDSV